MTTEWRPDWTLDPEPSGDDEDDARALYESKAPENGAAWDALPEWVRQAWRRELRDG